MGQSESKISYVEDRKGHDQRYSVNYDKLKQLGYLPASSFQEKLILTIDWYKNAQISARS